jgi:hypothetical protein
MLSSQLSIPGAVQCEVPLNSLWDENKLFENVLGKTGKKFWSFYGVSSPDLPSFDWSIYEF